jgi:ER-bound oxygenase mpaB/B'/Rubber oxygenase, catalytic domain
MNRYANLHRIQRLDPPRDFQEIYRTMILIDFGGWDSLMGLQLAFYRTYAIPSISRLLEQAGELIGRPRKRAIDTALLMLELVDHGFSHPRGQQVVRRLNRIHRRYKIANDDYLYVLGTLVFVPTRWLERYGWRPVCCHERTATYLFYRELGRRMGIGDIPASYQAFERWFDAFERAHLGVTPASRRLWQASRELLAGRFPAPLGSLAGGLADALLDERLRQAVGIDAPPWPIRAGLHLALRARARLLRLRPARHEPVEADGRKYGIPVATAYPSGYKVSDLGPADPLIPQE